MEREYLPLGKNPVNGTSYRCMLVDDTRTIRMILKQMLQSLGFEVIAEAEDGEEALQVLETLSPKPDIIFTDIEMPKMNGLDLARQIKYKGFQAKIIVVSSVADEHKVKESIIIGVDGYIIKPFERDTVLEKLARVMGRPDLSTVINR